MLASRLRTAATPTNKSFLLRSFSSQEPVVPRIVDRRNNELGPGGRGSDAGLKVAVFGASGFLGRNVCCHLGTSVCSIDDKGRWFSICSFVSREGIIYGLAWVRCVFHNVMSALKRIFYDGNDFFERI